MIDGMQHSDKNGLQELFRKRDGRREVDESNRAYFWIYERSPKGKPISPVRNGV
jgi:hypothetical protein